MLICACSHSNTPNYCVLGMLKYQSLEISRNNDLTLTLDIKFLGKVLRDHECYANKLCGEHREKLVTKHPPWSLKEPALGVGSLL